MAPSEPGGASPPVEPKELKAEWRLPTVSRVGKFVNNVLALEQTVEGLKLENRNPANQVQELQRQVDEQAGQMHVLIEFVRGALDDRIEARIRQALRARGGRPRQRMPPSESIG